MLIGTKDDNIEISLYLLREKSYLIDELYGDNLIDCENLISDNLKNIKLYHEYVKDPDNFLNLNNTIGDLCKLLKICSYLQDVNINRVSNRIIEMVNKSNISIHTSYSYLNLFHQCNLQLGTLKLLLVIVSKYGLNPLFEIVDEDGETDLNKYIINELSAI